MIRKGKTLSTVYAAGIWSCVIHHKKPQHYINLALQNESYPAPSQLWFSRHSNILQTEDPVEQEIHAQTTSCIIEGHVHLIGILGHYSKQLVSINRKHSYISQYLSQLIIVLIIPYTESNRCNASYNNTESKHYYIQGHVHLIGVLGHYLNSLCLSIENSVTFPNICDFIHIIIKIACISCETGLRHGKKLNSEASVTLCRIFASKCLLYLTGVAVAI